ncbi:hypothetical protein BDW59DRAFT_156602 [Aspergillus cavernicola]|uniref:Uncharacterized protein n=1 Tax=Aspergillus cavernicola TaxID=176166 RepID=A0ABR4J1L7_9EURO
MADNYRWFFYLYKKTQIPEDLDQAIKAAKRFVDLNPANDLPRISCLIYLIDWLEDRFLITKDYQHLNQVIEYGRLAVGKSTADLDTEPVIEFSTADMDSGHDKELLGCIDYLIKIYWRRFLVLKAVDDLDQGITLARVVLDALPPEHEDRHKYLFSLADLVEYTHTHTIWFLEDQRHILFPGDI